MAKGSLQVLRLPLSYHFLSVVGAKNGPGCPLPLSFTRINNSSVCYKNYKYIMCVAAGIVDISVLRDMISGQQNAYLSL